MDFPNSPCWATNAIHLNGSFIGFVEDGSPALLAHIAHMQPLHHVRWGVSPAACARFPFIHNAYNYIC
jgi:hypothetical protein